MRAKLLFCRKEASELIMWLLENRVTALQERREAASPPASGKRASAEAAPLLLRQLELRISWLEEIIYNLTNIH